VYCTCSIAVWIVYDLPTIAFREWVGLRSGLAFSRQLSSPAGGGLSSLGWRSKLRLAACEKSNDL
jgi:hypothetical protein